MGKIFSEIKLQPSLLSDYRLSVAAVYQKLKGSNCRFIVEGVGNTSKKEKCCLSASKKISPSAM